MSIGRIAPNEEDGKMEAHCSKCTWIYSTTVPGKAAKELYAHHEEEHS